VSGTRATFADFDEWTGALDRLNMELIKRGLTPVSLGYYLGDRHAKPHDLILAFIERRVIPYGVSDSVSEGTVDNILIHDAAFHSGAIFVPEYLWDYSVDNLRFSQSLYQHLKSIYLQGPYQETVVALVNALELMDYYVLDRTSALLAMGLFIPEFPDQLAQRYHEDLVTEFVNSTRSEFSDMIQSATPLFSKKSLTPRAALKRKIAVVIRETPYSRFFEEVPSAAFVEELQAKVDLVADLFESGPSFGVDRIFPVTNSQVLVDMQKRRSEIVQAVLGVKYSWWNFAVKP